MDHSIDRKSVGRRCYIDSNKKFGFLLARSQYREEKSKPIIVGDWMSWNKQNSNRLEIFTGETLTRDDKRNSIKCFHL